MYKIILLTISLFSFILGFITHSYIFSKQKTVIESAIDKIVEKPLEKYVFEKLAAEAISPGKLKVKEVIKENEKYTSYLFEFEFNSNLDGKTKKVTTGQINLPTGPDYELNHKFPVVLMFRGYVNQENYNTGDGTRRAAEYFANNGFVTIAPDFLGYGGSDKESGDIFETRFQTYVTGLTLLKTLELLPERPELLVFNQNSQPKADRPLDDKPIIFHATFFQANPPSIFIWGHSNGGQVAITLLEITGGTYPTTLWAPVTKPFPYSVLYYTDDSEDGGKLIRKELAKFENLYDSDKFSLTNYLERINAPIQIQQGTSDNAVPFEWSSEFATKLRSLKKEVSLYEYPETDHNMRPKWDLVAKKDLEFFRSYLK